MAPTIQRPGGPPPPGSGVAKQVQDKAGLSRSREQPDAARSELVCRVKYSNVLPDIPFDPKFLSYPFEPLRFIDYNPTTLESTHRHELLTEHDLGIHVDIILPDAYAQPLPGEEVVLHPKDDKLLEEDFGGATDLQRSQRHAQVISWMRRPDYISTEQTRYQPTTMDKVESKIGYVVRKKMGGDQHIYMDRDAQIEAIEKTFSDAQRPIKEHYVKKGVYPTEIIPILPDTEMWKYPCAQVIFDTDPAPVGYSPTSQIEMMSQAMIRGVMDESGEQFVAYFLPTADTMEKRSKDFEEGRDYDDEQEYEYKMAREYNWNVKSKSSKGYEENYFFVLKEQGFYYNELETRVRLSKRRLKQGQQPSNSKLVVRHRPLNKQEHKHQRFREKNLEPPMEDEEMSDDELEDEEGIQDTKDDEGNDNRSRSASGSRSRSRSRSKSGSRSRSGSKSSSRSRSRSKSASRSRSASRSPSGSRSRSGSRSKSGSRSPSGSRSRSASGSASSSKSRSGSGSRSSSRSRSGSRSRSESR